MKPFFVLRILLASLFISSAIMAQEGAPSNYFKVYMNALFDEQTRNLNDFPDDSTIYSLVFHDDEIGYFSPAFGFIEEDGDIHEIEISRISIGASRIDSLVVTEDPNLRSFTIRGDQTYTIHLAFRYEYMLNLRKSKEDAALKPFLGFSAQPYLRYFSHRSSITTEFPYSFLDLGAVVSIIPRITYDINSNWYLDLNVPFAAYRIQWLNDRFEDPRIPVENRSVNSVTTESFPSMFQVRFGAGMRF
jgi:hypothetical protein